MQEYYKLLGIKEGASEYEIKKAYYKKAKELHPDLNQSDDAQTEFIKVKNAYEYLTNGAEIVEDNHKYKQYHSYKQYYYAEYEDPLKDYKIEQLIRRLPRITKWYQVALIFVFFVICFVGIYQLKKYIKQRKLDKYGVTTICFVDFGTSDGQVKYFFMIGNIKYYFFNSAKTNYPYIVSKNGMPINYGDAFEVKYYSKNPKINEINFSKPTDKTIKKYILITADKIREINKDKLQEMSDKQKVHYSVYFAAEIYNKFGINGLSDIFFYDESFFENFSHNSYTFKKLSKKIEFKEIDKQAAIIYCP